PACPLSGIACDADVRMPGLAGHPSEMTGRHDRNHIKLLRLLRGDGPLLRIGPRGAAALAPANTIEAAEAALVHGVDLVELDVFGGSNRMLVLSHSRRGLTEKPVRLDDMLASLAENGPTTGILADVKFTGRERELVDALRAHGVLDRAIAGPGNGGTPRNPRGA